MRHLSDCLLQSAKKCKQASAGSSETALAHKSRETSVKCSSLWEYKENGKVHGTNAQMQVVLLNNLRAEQKGAPPPAQDFSFLATS